MEKVSTKYHSNFLTHYPFFSWSLGVYGKKNGRAEEKTVLRGKGFWSHQMEKHQIKHDKNANENTVSTTHDKI